MLSARISPSSVIMEPFLSGRPLCALPRRRRLCNRAHHRGRCPQAARPRHLSAHPGSPVAKAAPGNVVVRVLPQREPDAVHRLVVGVVLGAPDLQGVGIGVQIAVAQEEGVLRDLMAAPDHVIGHHRRVAAVGGQARGDAVAKDRIGTPALVVGRAGSRRAARPPTRPCRRPAGRRAPRGPRATSSCRAPNAAASPARPAPLNRRRSSPQSGECSRAASPPDRAAGTWAKARSAVPGRTAWQGRLKTAADFAFLFGSLSSAASAATAAPATMTPHSTSTGYIFRGASCRTASRSAGSPPTSAWPRCAGWRAGQSSGRCPRSGRRCPRECPRPAACS